jgi:aspartyl-tRNA(Asn)/glutamyl-tRNA(Gln) amidotransferase subunit A
LLGYAARSAPVSISLPIGGNDGRSGFPTYAGSPKRLPPKFEIDGPVVANLRRQLATVMGKTHMVEFAFDPSGHNAHYGSPRKPSWAVGSQIIGRL